jgi:MiaB/RimO family radical SAM methylthiotransferase
MRTFFIYTLGCKVNQYEGEQIATLLRSRGLRRVDAPESADLRVVHTCSVTVQAASKSRQIVRRMVRLPILGEPTRDDIKHGRVLVTGCWATSHPTDASQIPGVDAVIGHHDDLAKQIDALLHTWHGRRNSDQRTTTPQAERNSTHEDRPTTPLTNPTEPTNAHESSPEVLGNDGWMNEYEAGTPQRLSVPHHRLAGAISVKQIPSERRPKNVVGTRSLPLLGEERQPSHQRAFLKVQDGCDAHCTYCIIPQLRPTVWSKPLDDVLDEARRLTDVGYREIVLTGIFLGAYGHDTALRRRQRGGHACDFEALIDALCSHVPGLKRLRISSLEPGDLTKDLIAVLRSHAQVVPHFHLPLQSGSPELLRRMNRQYTRDEYRWMIDRVHAAFDRPAITTDIIVGFPGETDAHFAETLDIVDSVRFIHTHGFSYSPRPGTAAARLTDELVRGPIVNERIELLTERARQHSLEFRRSFFGETVEVMIEATKHNRRRHGRCERYFDVEVDDDIEVSAGNLVRAQITSVDEHHTRARLAAVSQGRPTSVEQFTK